MTQGKLYTFQEFVLDVDNACLRYEQERRALRPKAFDMLRYFVERPGQLVTKDEFIYLRQSRRSVYEPPKAV